MNFRLRRFEHILVLLPILVSTLIFSCAAFGLIEVVHIKILHDRAPNEAFCRATLETLPSHDGRQYMINTLNLNTSNYEMAQASSQARIC